MRPILAIALAFVHLASLSAVSRADDTPVPYAAAILPFEARGETAKEAVQVTDLLFAELLISDRLMLVERTSIDKVFDELKLSKTGAVNTEEATNVGKLTGAKLLVTGSVLKINGDLYLVAKVIGTETSRLSGASVKGDLNSDIGDLVAQLAEKINGVVEKKVAALMPKQKSEEDWITAMAEQLKGKQLPTVTVDIKEKHVGQQAFDPAAQTECQRLLSKLGFTLIDETTAKAKLADVLIKGEALSEFAIRRNDLVSVKCRVEIQAVQQADGKLLASDAETTMAIDLAEQIAGKSGIQIGTMKLLERLVPKLVVAP